MVKILQVSSLLWRMKSVELGWHTTQKLEVRSHLKDFVIIVTRLTILTLLPGSWQATRYVQSVVTA